MIEPQIFLLSPAHCGGKRAGLLLRPEAGFEVAQRIRSPEGASLGEVFSYVSGLYFRGKLTYARTFGRPPPGLPGALVITSGRGLLHPDTRIGPEDLARFATIPVDPEDARYREPLMEDLAELRAKLPPDARVVLLGSIATPKYVELLLAGLGPRLCFPAPFPGMGDMARGALLLDAATRGAELDYLPAECAARSLAARRAPRPA